MSWNHETVAHTKWWPKSGREMWRHFVFGRNKRSESRVKRVTPILFACFVFKKGPRAPHSKEERKGARWVNLVRFFPRLFGAPSSSFGPVLVCCGVGYPRLAPPKRKAMPGMCAAHGGVARSEKCQQRARMGRKYTKQNFFRFRISGRSTHWKRSTRPDREEEKDKNAKSCAKHGLRNISQDAFTELCRCLLCSSKQFA